MFQNTISIHPWLNFPQITQKCDLAEVIMKFCKKMCKYKRWRLMPSENISMVKR